MNFWDFKMFPTKSCIGRRNNIEFLHNRWSQKRPTLIRYLKQCNFQYNEVLNLLAPHLVAYDFESNRPGLIIFWNRRSSNSNISNRLQKFQSQIILQSCHCFSIFFKNYIHNVITNLYAFSFSYYHIDHTLLESDCFFYYSLQNIV